MRLMLDVRDQKMAWIASIFLLAPVGIVVLFWGTFEVLKDRDIVLDIVVATLICAATYGVAAFVFVRFLARRLRTMPTSIVVLALMILWIPCLFLGIQIASLIPLVWGHAGEMFFVPFVGASPGIFVWGVTMYKRSLISNTAFDRDAPKAARRSI